MYLAETRERLAIPGEAGQMQDNQVVLRQMQVAGR
jgi:hypothetical protein